MSDWSKQFVAVCRNCYQKMQNGNMKFACELFVKQAKHKPTDEEQTDIDTYILHLQAEKDYAVQRWKEYASDARIRGIKHGYRVYDKDGTLLEDYPILPDVAKWYENYMFAAHMIYLIRNYVYESVRYSGNPINGNPRASSGSVPDPRENPSPRP